MIHSQLDMILQMNIGLVMQYGMYVGIIRGILRRNAKIYHRTGWYSDKWQLFKSDFQSTVHSFIGVFLLWIENVPCKCLCSAPLFIMVMSFRASPVF